MNLPARIPTVKTPGSHEAERRSRSDRLAELETICRYDRASETANVFTCEKGLAASLLRRGMKPTQENVRDGRVESWCFEVPKSWVAVRPPRKVSEAHREAARRLGLARLHRRRRHSAGELVPVEG